MSIVVFCTNHSPALRLTLSDDRAGSVLPCPKCDHMLVIPSLSASAAPASPRYWKIAGATGLVAFALAVIATYLIPEVRQFLLLFGMFAVAACVLVLLLVLLFAEGPAGEEVTGRCQHCKQDGPLFGSTGYCRTCAGGVWCVLQQNQKKRKRTRRGHRPH